MFKNEALRLKEWLTYHYVCGFKNYVLIDDHSTDASRSVIKEVTDKFSDISVQVLPNDLGELGFKGGVDTERYRGSHALLDVINYNFKKAFDLLKEKKPIIGYYDVDEFLFSKSKPVADEVRRLFQVSPEVVMLAAMDFQADYLKFSVDRGWITAQTTAETTDQERRSTGRSETRKCFINLERSVNFFIAPELRPASARALGIVTPHNLGIGEDTSKVAVPSYDELAFLHYRHVPYYTYLTYSGRNQHVAEISLAAQKLWQ